MANMGTMRFKLPELQESNLEAKKIRNTDLLISWKDVKDILQYHNIFYVLEILFFKVIIVTMTIHWQNTLKLIKLEN